MVRLRDVRAVGRVRDDPGTFAAVNSFGLRARPHPPPGGEALEVSKRRLAKLTSRWLLIFAAAMIAAAGIGAASAAAPTFVGSWDMTTSQGGYFSVVMESGRDGTILGTFENSVPNQSGTWIGRLVAGGIDMTIVLKQPGLGLTGKGQLFLLGDDTFQGSIEESAADGSHKVKVTVRGTRKAGLKVPPFDRRT
jgi:hypothetical protein